MSIGTTTMIWTWIAVGAGVVGVFLVIKFWKYLKEHSRLITIALSATEDIASYLSKEKKIPENVADFISSIRAVGTLAVTAAEEKANGGKIPPEKKFETAKEIAKTILKQKNITLSEKELEDYLNSALNIARATGILSEQKTKKKVTPKKKKVKPEIVSQNSSNTT